MILLIDIGNSYTKIKMDNDFKEAVTASLNTVDDCMNLLEWEKINGAIISSVVRGKSELFMEAIFRKYSITPIVVDPFIKHSIDYGDPNLNELGPDLMCLMEGISKRKRSFIGVSLGTATVVMVVKNMKFMGCAISPGAKTSLRSLIDSASLIEDTEMDGVFSLLGLTTDSAVKSGVYNAAVFIVDGYVDRIKEVYGNLPTYVVGGLSTTICPHMKNETIVEKDLIFEGLSSLYTLNKE